MYLIRVFAIKLLLIVSVWGKGQTFEEVISEFSLPKGWIVSYEITNGGFAGLESVGTVLFSFSDDELRIPYRVYPCAKEDIFELRNKYFDYQKISSCIFTIDADDLTNNFINFWIEGYYFWLECPRCNYGKGDVCKEFAKELRLWLATVPP